MLKTLCIIALAFFLTSCGSSNKRKPALSKRASDIDYYSICLKERSESYCNRILGKDQ